MTYRPQRKNLSAVFLSIFCFVFSVIAFYIAPRIGTYMWVYQITAIILAIFALQIFLKYAQSDYVYKADEHDLKIYKITGDKSALEIRGKREHCKTPYNSFYFANTILRDGSHPTGSSYSYHSGQAANASSSSFSSPDSSS